MLDLGPICLEELSMAPRRQILLIVVFVLAIGVTTGIAQTKFPKVVLVPELWEKVDAQAGGQKTWNKALCP